MYGAILWVLGDLNPATRVVKNVRIELRTRKQLVSN